jgi:hypothetical protein
MSKISSSNHSNEQIFVASTPNYKQLTRCFEAYSEGDETLLEVHDIAVLADGWGWVDDMVSKWSFSMIVPGASEDDEFPWRWRDFLKLKLGQY